MGTILGSLGKATTAWLALGAGATPANAATTFQIDNALQHNTSDNIPFANRKLLEVARPGRIAGRPMPDYCGATPAPQANPVGMVVAHHSEDLSWLNDHRANATIYDKGNDNDVSTDGFRAWINLPNIGLESHTYLYHIVSHWNCLDDATLFTQGRVDDSVDNYQGVDELLQRTLASPEGMILYRAPGTFNEWWGVWHFGKWKDELDTGLMRKSDRNPGEFWTWMFNGAAPPEQIEWTWSATFAVRRETIQRRPLRFYRKLLNHFENINHVKPEEGHFMERFWLSVFKSDAGMQPPHRPDRRNRREFHSRAKRDDALP